jgi:hypothetical protein
MTAAGEADLVEDLKTEKRIEDFVRRSSKPGWSFGRPSSAKLAAPAATDRLGTAVAA